MAKEQTQKSKWPSRYSPEQYVTGAQYIIELVCEKKAQQDGKDLPMRFWRQDEWAHYFKMQLRQCHKLLKQYEEKAIIYALKDSRAKRIYSLHAPHLVPLIVEHAKKIQAIKEKEKTTIQTPSANDKIVVAARPQIEKKGIISKLKALE